MAETKTTNRWLMVAAALVMQLCLGVLYSWSVFRGPLMKELGWTVKQAGYPFMASLFFFTIAMILAGRWQDKAGPRKVAIFGGLLLGAGALLAGVLYKTVPGLVFAYGILGGLGVGFAYVTPIATCIKWFPDMRGTITGLAVFGFGAGTLIFGPLISKLIAGSGIAPAFFTVGAIMLVGVCGAGSMFKVPPPGYKPAGWNPPAPKAGAPKVGRDFTFGETVKSIQFWLLYAAYFCGSFAGLMVIGVMAAHGINEMNKEAAALAGVAVKELPADVTKAIAMQAAIATSALNATNAIVRVLIGAIADKTGTRICFLVTFILQVVAMLVLFPVGKSLFLLCIVAIIIGWNYGAMFTLFPATLLQYYGPTAQGSNYGLLFTAWGVAGFCGPYLGGKIQAITGSYLVPFAVAAGVLAVSVVILMTLKAPEKKHA